MKPMPWCVIVFSLLLAACDGEPKPQLQTEGHWLVDHGLSDDCQVSATFADELMILTFYSLIEGACRPEDYGIKNNALALQVDTRKDFLSDDGVVSATLSLSVPARSVAGVISLRESVTGIDGSMVEASDPQNMLGPLVGLTYKLTAVTNTWEPKLRGTWGLLCSEFGFSEDNGDLCPLIKFIDETHGTAFIRVGSSCSPLPKTGECVGGGTQVFEEDFIYALRNYQKVSDNETQLDIVVMLAGEASPELPARITITEDILILELQTDEGVYEPHSLQRMVD